MVILPRDISPAAGARRSLLIDLLIAIALALAGLQIAAGIGVVGFLAALVVVVLVAWIAVERAVRRLFRPRKSQRPRAGRVPSRAR